MGSNPAEWQNKDMESIVSICRNISKTQPILILLKDIDHFTMPGKTSPVFSKHSVLSLLSELSAVPSVACIITSSKLTITTLIPNRIRSRGCYTTLANFPPSSIAMTYCEKLLTLPTDETSCSDMDVTFCDRWNKAVGRLFTSLEFQCFVSHAEIFSKGFPYCRSLVKSLLSRLDSTTQYLPTFQTFIDTAEFGLTPHNFQSSYNMAQNLSHDELALFLATVKLVSTTSCQSVNIQKISQDAFLCSELSRVLQRPHKLNQCIGRLLAWGLLQPSHTITSSTSSTLCLSDRWTVSEWMDFVPTLSLEQTWDLVRHVPNQSAIISQLLHSLPKNQ